jgi:hypothetical protein
MTASISVKDLTHRFYSNAIAGNVQILPIGIKLANKQITPEIKAEVLSFAPAKTRYEKNQPVCHSPDAIQAPNVSYACCSCRLRKNCTPQMRLDIICSNGKLRFLLQYASLRNFMLFLSALAKQKIPLQGSTITIKVLNRGRWAEVQFFL